MTAGQDWFEDDAFWSEMAPYMFHEQRMAATPIEVDQLLALLELPPGAGILDLCCGPGRHSLELARRGYRVTGVDRTAAYLESARRQGQAENLEIEFVQADMRAFRRAASFDAALNLYTSFGFFSDPADDRRVLENIRASLNPGGMLVIETMGKEVLARTFRERDWHREDDGALFLEERTLLADWSALEARWILIRGAARREHGFRLRLYSAAELRDLIHDVGFGAVRACGSLAGVPYDHQARRLVMVARV
ncbi:MAG: class I SAM-dependent methyltransferase [Candidatus Eisenbacteria bacterium]